MCNSSQIWTEGKKKIQGIHDARKSRICLQFQKALNVNVQRCHSENDQHSNARIRRAVREEIPKGADVERFGLHRSRCAKE